MSNVEPELAMLRQEIQVIARVLEEAGIKFNRDYQGRIVGVMMEAEAVVSGQSKVDN